MTRQKKEILKKIDDMYEWIAVDEQLGCGFAPPGAYDSMYDEIHRMEDDLARLRHYECAEAMFYDERGCGGEVLPF